MRTIDQWLTEYGASHLDPVNKMIHRVAVPIIVLDVIGFLHLLPTRGIGLPPASWLLVAASLAFYARLSPRLALGMAILAVPAVVALDAALAGLGAWALPALLAIFGLTWTAQFIGHAIEGEKPSFCRDLQFLLIGPLWLLADAYDRLGLDSREGATPYSVG